MASDFLEKLLEYYQVDEEGYALLTAPPSFSSIPLINDDPMAIKSKDRILKAKERKEKIIVYGDYDTDGVMSTSIVLDSLKQLGIEAKGYLPSRYLDGYGMNIENAKKIAKSGYTLVIETDNGVAAKEANSYLMKEGIDVIIIDHHAIQGEIAPCYSIIHPVTLAYGEYAVSAGYLSFLFSIVLLGKIDDYLATLGGISTLSDMMPLKGYNRELLRLAIGNINREGYPEILSLSEKQGELTYEDLSMGLIPAINAIGRMEEDTSINRLLGYFVRPFEKKKLAVANWMKQVNQQRKDATRSVSSSIEIEEGNASITAVLEVKEGLNGLLASRLLSMHGKPVAVFSKKAGEEGILVGSARAPEGYNLASFVETRRDLLETGGGHALAAGISIKEENLSAFKANFEEFAKEKTKISAEQAYILIEVGDATLENLEIVESFAPFGNSWQSPKFLLKNYQKSNLSFTEKGGYLSSLLPAGSRLFSFTLQRHDFEANGPFDFIVSFRRDSWKGRQRCELLAEKIAE